MNLRLPAEWETHAATWLIWPESRDWPGKLAAVRWAYGEMIRWISQSEAVRLLVRSEKSARAAEQLLSKVHADMGRVHVHVVDTDRSWARDTCPEFVKNGKETRLAAFRFNGWARYATHTRDALVPQAVTSITGLDLHPVEHQGRHMVLEGGAIDANGQGVLMTTEECLLHPARQVRNPGFGRREYEAAFAEHLGVRQTIWLPGGIAGDDTHGHVDDVCRFVNPNTVVLCREDDPADPNHAVCEANRKVLAGTHLVTGSSLHIVDLPMPKPLYFENIRLPASYVNFCITNSHVLVPTFNDPADRKALTILGDCFPSRTVVGIHAVDLILGLGSLHCLTHEQPA